MQIYSVRTVLGVKHFDVLCDALSVILVAKS